MSKTKKRSKPPELIKPRLENTSFYYQGVKCDYSTNSDGCSCIEDGDFCCRCSTIENARATNVEIDKVGQYIAQLFNVKSEIDLYCIDRVLYSFKVWSPDSWDVRVEKGYYGEEIDGIFLKQANEIEQKLDEILQIDNLNSQIEALLVLEYGYLLNILDNCKYTIEYVDKSRISYQEDHYKKLDRAAVKAYEHYSHPRGIVKRKQGDRYHLIDGYHRIAAGTGQLKMFVARKT